MSTAAQRILWANHVQQFENQFPTVEDRYEAAVQLADPAGTQAPEAIHTGRNLLAAHWGDDTAGLLEVGSFLYPLKAAVDAFTHHPIIIVHSGSIEELLSPNDKLDDVIQLTYGLISSQELTLGFTGNLQRDMNGRTRMGIAPPYLGFGILVEIARATKISADKSGEYEATRPSQTKQLVPAYIGTVTLLENEYHTERKIERRTTLIGREICDKVEAALRRKTSAKALPNILGTRTAIA